MFASHTPGALGEQYSSFVSGSVVPQLTQLQSCGGGKGGGGLGEERAEKVAAAAEKAVAEAGTAAGAEVICSSYSSRHMNRNQRGNCW